jgi:hypothetical protein
MATITAASNPIRKVAPDRWTFFGYPVPSNVTALALRYDPMNAQDVIQWRVEHTAEVHTMDLPVVTDETIFAVLAAMRLSC